ncbi:MAG: hypothetical protein FWD73_07010 [Polyangiaceae bacterium]|nr:hypothetical protein [Polyangiaceae bacterium]
MAAKKKATAKKKRMGRPPRAGGAATGGIFVRLTEAEHERLAAAAKDDGKPLATFVRDAALARLEKA